MKDELPIYAEGPVKEIAPTESALPEKRKRVLLVSGHTSRSVIGLGLMAALSSTASPMADRIPHKGGYDGFDIQPVPDYQSMMTPRNQRRMQKKALKKPRR